MPKLPIIKPKELVRVLQRLGFFEFHRVGSHAQFKHSDGRRVTVAVGGIINDLDVSVEEFVKMLKS